MVFKFTLVENVENAVAIEGHHLNLQLLYGLKPTQFLQYYKKLRDNYNLRINKYEFDETANLGKEKKAVKVRGIKEYASFIIYSNLLEAEGIDIKNLVSQMRPCKDYREIRHARGLAELGWVYHNNGYRVEYLPKKNNPDLSINGITADLKVTQPVILTEYYSDIKVSGGVVDIGHEIMREITQQLKSRFTKGIKQADMLFFDLSGNRFFSALNLVMFKNTPHFIRVSSPKKYRAIFYSTKNYPPDIELHVQGSNETMTTKFPNVFSFVGYSIDFEELLWEAIRNVQPT